MKGNMTPLKVICQSSEAEKKCTGEERNIVPLLRVSAHRCSDSTGQCGGAGDLGGKFIALGDPGCLEVGSGEFDMPRTGEADGSPGQ